MLATTIVLADQPAEVLRVASDLSAAGGRQLMDLRHRQDRLGAGCDSDRLDGLRGSLRVRGR
jgi:hypothetical protein